MPPERNDLNWVALAGLDSPMECMVKIRSAQRELEARIEPAGEGILKVTFHRPAEGVSPGQSAVFYRDDMVLAGGVIGSGKAEERS